jgi:hypothetical protein
MRRSIIEYWSNRRIFWQQYSSFHNSQYCRRFYRLLTDRSNQLFDSTEIDLNRCKRECRCRCSAFNSWSICIKLVSSQMSLRMRHWASLYRQKKISFSTIRRSSHLFFLMTFFSRLLTFLRAHFTVVLILEFVSRIFSIFFIILSFDFHSIERSSSIK